MCNQQKGFPPNFQLWAYFLFCMSVSVGVIEHAPILSPVNSWFFIFSVFTSSKSFRKCFYFYSLFFNLVAYKHTHTHTHTHTNIYRERGGGERERDRERGREREREGGRGEGYVRTNVVGSRTSFVIATVGFRIY